MIILLICCYWFTSTSATICTDGTSVGNENFKKEHDNVDDVSGVMFLMVAPLYRYSCCGLVKQFKSYAMIDGDIYYLIWRPVDDRETYRLVASSKSTLADTPRTSSILPSGNSQPQVMDGDIIGWYSPGSSPIPYVPSTEDGMTSYMMERVGVPEVGDVVDWTAAQQLEQRRYAVDSVVISAAAPPEFKKVPEAVDVQAEATVGSVVFNVPVTDPHYKDTVVTVNPNQFFDINDDGAIAVASPLVSGSYELVVTATDICGLASSASITVTVTKRPTSSPTDPVLPSNTPPPVDPDPDTTNSVRPAITTNSTDISEKTSDTAEEDIGWKYAIGFTVFVVAFIIIGLTVLWMWKTKRKRQETKPIADAENSGGTCDEKPTETQKET